VKKSEKIAQDLKTERGKLKTWLDENRTEDGQLDLDAEGVTRFRTWNEELAKQNGALKDALDIEAAADGNDQALAALDRPTHDLVFGRGEAMPGAMIGTLAEPKTVGRLFVESAQFKASQHLPEGISGKPMEIDLDAVYGPRQAFATLFDTSTGYAPQSIRLPTPITPGEQPVTVASLMPEGRTSQASIAYMEETTTTNAAAETAEGAAKPEAALAFTEKTSAVRKIATSLPVTDESLEDVPFVESYIDSRLGLFVRQREDSQLLVGNGTAPNLRGILNVSGIGTQARGTDASQDAIFKAATVVFTQSFLDATGVVIHPTNWQTIRLMTTVDGIYLFGPPSQPGPDSIWGYDVVRTTAITLNTGLVGAFRSAAEIFRRSDVAISIGWINDQFVKNQRTILAEERLALVVFRPKGFCKVTGLN
jgi:HK97 family phage major capsid protein